MVSRKWSPLRKTQLLAIWYCCYLSKLVRTPAPATPLTMFTPAPLKIILSLFSTMMSTLINTFFLIIPKLIIPTNNRYDKQDHSWTWKVPGNLLLPQSLESKPWNWSSAPRFKTVLIIYKIMIKIKTLAFYRWPHAPLLQLQKIDI